MSIFEECLKCEKDFSYFCEKYIKINHPRNGIIPFKLYDYQKRIVKSYDDNRFIITKKFRQGGFSTLNAIYGLWKCMFSLNNKFLYLTKTDRLALELSKIVKFAINNLSNELKPTLSTNNEHQKDFANTNSRIMFLPPQASCSISMTHLFIEEPSFIQEIEDHWLSLYPCISAEGKCVLCSTPSDTKNWFYDTYKAAEKNTNCFKIFDAAYNEHPDYGNEAWIQMMKTNLGDDRWRREFECEWID